MAENFWKIEGNVERLTQLWADGFSCSEISRTFGGQVTRCGVMGKVHRLGLPPRATTTRSANARTNRLPPTPRPKPIAVEPPLPVVEEDPITLEDGSHATILTITDRMCRWPIGDPLASDFHFCGRSPRSGAPYCESHCRRAYQPQMTIVSRKKAAAVEAAMADAQAYKSMRRMFG